MRDHRRKAKERRLVAAMYERAVRQATNDLMDGMLRHNQPLRRATSAPPTTATDGPMRLTPYPIRDFTLKLVKYQVMHGGHFAMPHGWSEDDMRQVYRSKAAEALAQHMIDNQLITERVEQLDNRHVTVITWECLIGKES
jgi:hypothetical protein